MPLLYSLPGYGLPVGSTFPFYAPQMVKPITGVNAPTLEHASIGV